MNKMANRWEVPVSPIIPYLCWYLQEVEQLDGGAKGWQSNRHDHAFYEMYIILSGECDLFINNAKRTLQAGQGILIEPKVFHATDSVTQSFCRLSVTFYPDDERLLQRLSWKNSFLVFTPDDEIINMSKSISLEIKNEGGLFHKELLAVQVSQLMLKVFRSIEENRFDAQQNFSHPRQLEDMMVIDVFFGNTPPKLRTKENLAKLLSCSERQVLRKIRTLYGMSFQQKQILSRIDTAQHLLRVSDKSVEEICAFVGYADTAAFYKAFKTYTHTTPVKYRKRAKSTDGPQSA